MTSLVRKIVALTVVVLVSCDIFGQISTKSVRTEIDKIRQSRYMRNGQFGFALYDAETGTLLEKERPDESLLPASTMKTVTSGAALSILGEDYKFKTVLEYDGTVEGGTLKGNIIIRGGGDPTLGSERFKWGTDMPSILAIWVKKIKEKGIQRIDGMIIGDASIFEDAMLPTTWVWSDIGNYYGAGACGLSFNENLYYVFFKPHAVVGKPAAMLRVEPPMPAIEFVNEMKTGTASSGDQGYIYGAPYTYLRYLRGSIPQGGEEFSIKGSIPDPALFAAQCLHSALIADSVRVTGPAETIRQLGLNRKLPTGTRNALYTHLSPPLKDIVYWLNKKSINLYAEQLVKMIGWVKYKDGSNESGTKAISEHWASKGIDTEGLHINDGSGLSRYNGVTPAQLAGMLRINVKEPWFETFFNSLPIAGDPSDPGTLKSMGQGTAAAKNVRAKSGYIARVRTYTGYVNTKSGRQLCFAMMANNYTCSNSQMKDMLESLMVALAEIP